MWVEFLLLRDERIHPGAVAIISQFPGLTLVDLSEITQVIITLLIHSWFFCVSGQRVARLDPSLNHHHLNVI